MQTIESSDGHIFSVGEQVRDKKSGDIVTIRAIKTVVSVDRGTGILRDWAYDGKEDVDLEPVPLVTSDGVEIELGQTLYVYGTPYGGKVTEIHHAWRSVDLNYEETYQASDLVAVPDKVYLSFDRGFLYEEAEVFPSPTSSLPRHYEDQRVSYRVDEIISEDAISVYSNDGLEGAYVVRPTELCFCQPYYDLYGEEIRQGDFLSEPTGDDGAECAPPHLFTMYESGISDPLEVTLVDLVSEGKSVQQKGSERSLRRMVLDSWTSLWNDANVADEETPRLTVTTFEARARALSNRD